MDNQDSPLLTILMITIGAPLLFLKWLFTDDNFGAGKAIVFVIAMFLFGSIFFFN